MIFSNIHGFQRLIQHSSIVSNNYLHMTTNINAVDESLALKVFIGNLSYTFNENDLKHLIISKLGSDKTIKSTSIPQGKKSKRGLGFAFIDFHTKEQAKLAAEKLNQIIFQDRIINANVKIDSEPSLKTSKKLRNDKNCIYIANLEDSLNEDDLIQMCNDILNNGDIANNIVVSVELPIDKFTNNRRGFAYIEFKNETYVDKSLVELNNVEVLGKLLYVLKKQKQTKKMTTTSFEDEFSIEDV